MCNLKNFFFPLKGYLSSRIIKTCTANNTPLMQTKEAFYISRQSKYFLTFGNKKADYTCVIWHIDKNETGEAKICFTDNT